MEISIKKRRLTDNYYNKR